jgi:hypothetical protein
VDFYCLSCGYNLRGLAGDPKRCPECFHVNSIDELAVTAQEIERQLRRLETGPTSCAVGVLLFGAGLVTMLFEGLWCFAPTLCVAALVLWGTGARALKESCRGQSGHTRLLLRFHLYGLSIIVIGIGVPAACAYAVVRMLDRVNATVPVLCALYPTVALVVFVLVCWGICVPIHRRLRGELRALQRDTAVELARRVRRERLGRQMQSGG